MIPIVRKKFSLFKRIPLYGSENILKNETELFLTLLEKTNYVWRAICEDDRICGKNILEDDLGMPLKMSSVKPDPIQIWSWTN